MIKLGSLPLNGTPRVAIGFAGNTPPQLIQNAKDYGLDIVELRIDLYPEFRTAYVLSEVKKFRHFPSIATIRSKKEGGKWDRSDRERLSLFKVVIPEVDAVDIELSSRTILGAVIKAAHQAEKLVVISHHDLDKTPSIKELNRIVNKAKSLGADIVKVATYALNDEDVQTLAELTIANKSKNIVTIAMGDKGTKSRIIFPALGSLMTYASLGNQSTAPGQLDYMDTCDLLRRLYPQYNEIKITSLKLLEAV